MLRIHAQHPFLKHFPVHNVRIKRTEYPIFVKAFLIK